AMITLARSLKASGSLDKAIAVYNQIINQKPEESIFLELGECYIKQNKLDDAKVIFERILELPTSTLHGLGYSLDYLARIAIDQEKFVEAQNRYIQLLEVLNKLSPLDPESIASTQGNLGFIFLKTGNTNRAWEFFRIAAKYFNKNKNWDELITLGNNYRNEFVINRDFGNALIILNDFILPAIKKTQDKKIENQYHYETALLYHMNGETEVGLEYWKRNRNNKVSFQKYSAPVMKAIQDKKVKKELEKQHLRFLKRIIDLQ
ncbi:MAG: tetratricopeptide repeat protein, partial [Promethearchaeota archaeon]